MLRNACYFLIFLSFLRRLLRKFLPSGDSRFNCDCPIPFSGRALCIGFDLNMGPNSTDKRIYIPLKQVPLRDNGIGDNRLDKMAERYGLKVGMNYFSSHSEYIYRGFYYKWDDNSDGNNDGVYVRTIPDIQTKIDEILRIVQKVIE